MKRLIDNKNLFYQLVNHLAQNYYSHEIHSWFTHIGADASWFEFHNTGKDPSHQTAYSWCKSLQDNGDDDTDKMLISLIEMLLKDKPDESKALQRYLKTKSAQQSVNNDIDRDVEQVLKIVLKGLSRSLGLIRKRSKISAISPFHSRYDYYTLILGMLAPWFKKIETEVYILNDHKYSTILLPEHDIAIIGDIIGNRIQAKNIVENLSRHITYFQSTRKCKTLWIVLYDAMDFIEYPERKANEINNAVDKLIVNCLIVES